MCGVFAVWLTTHSPVLFDLCALLPIPLLGIFGLPGPPHFPFPLVFGGLPRAPNRLLAAPGLKAQQAVVQDRGGRQGFGGQALSFSASWEFVPPGVLEPAIGKNHPITMEQDGISEDLGDKALEIEL